MRRFLIFLALSLGFQVHSSAIECRSGLSGEPLSLEKLVASVSPGSTLFLGELHGVSKVAEGQVEILKELRRQGHGLNVAMEFFPRKDQGFVDQFLNGTLTEALFLSSIGWPKATDFSHYRQQVTFPLPTQGERTLAINASRALTSIVAKRGLDGLSQEERKQLPPGFQVGRPEYYERFREAMEGGHIDESAMRRYFEAQSVWDETMAWSLIEAHSLKTTVVVVGEFHVGYGGGLPYQMAQRAPSLPLTTLSFFNRHGMTEEELQRALSPHHQWGPRANFICLVDLESETSSPDSKESLL